MATLIVHTDYLEIKLSRGEKIASLHRSDLEIPLDKIRSAALTDDPWVWVRGLRSPGLGVPGNVAVGTWRFHDGKDFLLVRGKKPAVVIDIDDFEYARVIISTSHAVTLIKALRLPPAEEDPAKKIAEG